MRKKFFKLGAIALTMSSAALNVNAQVGINTENPKATLDIVQRDTATVKGKGFRLVDGHQNAGFVLTSDATGIGTWEASVVSMVLGYFSPNLADQVSMPYQTMTPLKATKAYLDLPPGMWRVDLSFFIVMTSSSANSTDRVRVMVSFCSDIANLSTYNTKTTPELGISNASGSYRSISGYIYNNIPYNNLAGTLVIRNSSTTTKRFYAIIEDLEGQIATPSANELYRTAAYNSENTMMAIPIMGVY